MSHKSKILLVMCSDPRLRNWEEKYIRQNRLGPTDTDRIIVPGPAPALAGHFTPEHEKMISAWIRKLYELHNFEKVLLTSHEDCGAVGGSKKFSSESDEQRHHFEWCRKAKDAVRISLPENVKITTYYITKKEFQ